MKKLLIASTALSLAGGAAFAEISISGDAELGVDYNSEAGEGMSKHSFVHEVGIDFSASGTTDGGLTFGGSAGFDTNAAELNLGTVHVSGSFGTLTIGDNDPGSFIAGGIADIGMNGIGVDDMAESLRGGTASQLRYDNSFGQVSIAISAGTKDGKPGVAAVARKKGTFYYAVPGDEHKELVTGTEGVSTTVFSAYHIDDQTDKDPAVPMVNAAAYKTAVVAYVTGAVGADSGASLTISGSTITFDADGNESDADPIELGGTIRRGGTGKSAKDDEDPTKFYDSDGNVAIVTDADGAAFDRLAKAYNVNDEGFLVATDGNISGPNPERVALVAPTKAMATVPAVSAETEFAFGMNFETGGVTIGLGYDSNKTISMGAGFSAGEISTNLLYVKMDDDEDKDGNQEATSMGVDLSYSMGASKVTLAYGRHKPEEEGKEAMDAVGMGVTHDLGGGATMNAGFGKVDMMDDDGMIVSQNKASIGLMFAF